MITHWRKAIKEKGTQSVATALGISYQAAHKYVSGTAMPRDRRRKALLEYMRSKMSGKEYSVFRASLNAELMGEE